MTARWPGILIFGLGVVAAILSAGLASAEDGSGDGSGDDAGGADDTHDDEKPVRLFAVTKKFIEILPRSWSGPILDSQTSFEKFLRWSFSGGDELDAPPVPARVSEQNEVQPEPTLSSEFFFRPISGGTPLLGIESSRFRGSLVLGRDFRARTLNSTFGEQPDLWSTDPTVSEFALDAANLNLETFYETYQLVPQAVYIRVEF